MQLFKNKIVGGTVFLVFVFIAIAYIVYGKSDKELINEIKYKEFRVEQGTFQMTVTANGTIIPIDRIQIKSKASGIVVELPVEQGDFIKKGSLIAKLDQKDELAELGQAQANYDISKAEIEQAQRTFERLDQLYSENLISEEERDQIELNLAIAKGKLVQAKTALERSKERLGESIVRAPINGIILQKYIEEGQIITSGVNSVSGGNPIVDIADMRNVYVQAGIDEIDIGKIRVGQSATVMAEAYPLLKFKGKLVRISPEAKIEQNVTLFDVVVEVENKEGKLKSGMNTTIEITIVKKENVLLANTAALQMSPAMSKEKNIRTVNLKQGTDFINREVEIGLYDFKYVEVLAGLKAGDILGVPMTSRLKDENDRMQDRIRNRTGFSVSGR